MNLPQLSQILADAAKKAYNVGGLKPEISYPDPKFGDYATNVAFGLAKELRAAPAVIAEKICTSIDSPLVAESSAVNGFINLRMTEQYWIGQLHGVTPSYGQSELGKGKKALVEFISANPTGPLTLANGRGGYLGDVLANVLAHSGYHTEREYLLNDAGHQIDVLKASVKAAAMEALTGKPQALQESYKGEYITHWGQAIAADIKRRQPVASQNPHDLEHIVEEAVREAGVLQRIIGQLKEAVARMGIEFDTWFSELASLHANGKVGEVVQELIDKGLAQEREGAIWMQAEESDRGDRVLRKSDGTFTYLAADLAYHRNKLAERQFDLAINLWGADHAGQVPSLKHGLKLLRVPGKLDVLLFQLVRLIKDGAEYKVSKRAGTYVTIDELLDEIPSDVLRFFFLMRSPGTPMDLDLDLAAEQSQKNPYYYVMYSYARANSIMEQATARGLTPLDTLTMLSRQEVALIRQMSRFPALVGDIARDYGAHRLSFYGIELARAFHELYESEHIIGLDKAAACKRLYVIQRYTVFMRLYFGLLGISPQEKMVSPEPPA